MSHVSRKCAGRLSAEWEIQFHAGFGKLQDHTSYHRVRVKLPEGSLYVSVVPLICMMASFG
jgi:hypothetical protein